MTAAAQPPTTHSQPRPSSRTGTVVVLFAVGALVAVALGVYGRVHSPTGTAFTLAGFSTGAYAKAWLATIVLIFALVQVITALIMYGRIRLASTPSWISPLHRWSGRIAVLVSVPVAVHCLYALGFAFDEPRVLVHSLLGCLIYGAFVTKMLALTRRGLPGWVLAGAGGVAFTALVGLWLTSSLWLFTTSGFTF